MKYICKQCNQEAEAQSIEQVIKANKICHQCLDKNHKERARLYNSNHKTKKKEKEKICPVCKNKFLTLQAKYCSKECRTTGMRLTIIDNNLKKIQSLKDTMETKVYNFGDYQQYK